MSFSLLFLIQNSLTLLIKWLLIKCVFCLRFLRISLQVRIVLKLLVFRNFTYSYWILLLQILFHIESFLLKLRITGSTLPDTLVGSKISWNFFLLCFFFPFLSKSDLNFSCVSYRFFVCFHNNWILLFFIILSLNFHINCLFFLTTHFFFLELKTFENRFILIILIEILLNLLTNIVFI